MRKVFAVAALAGALMISACNTVSGVGRDVSSAGNAVSDAAEPVK
jgi:predicted small secreted protein